MYFYVGENALTELNEKGYTPILNEEGWCIGGHLKVTNDGVDCPYIYDLFGSGEIIRLDEVELEDEDHFNCTIITESIHSCFALYILKSTKVGWKSKWTRE